MDFVTTPQIIEAIGWLAVVLKLSTFSMNSMIWLRALAMASSVFFIIYSGFLQIWPLLAVEVVLFSMNAYRLYAIVALHRLVTHMTDDTEPDFSQCIAYGKKNVIGSGEVVFKKGDPVDSLYYLYEGRVQIGDQNIFVEPGRIFGEMAFSTALRNALRRCTVLRTRLCMNLTKNALLVFNTKIRNLQWP